MRAGRSNFFEAERHAVRRESVAKQALARGLVTIACAVWLAMVVWAVSIPAGAVATAIIAAAQHLHFEFR